VQTCAVLICAVLICAVLTYVALCMTMTHDGPLDRTRKSAVLSFPLH
jgi:hypothetical protein